MTETNSDTQQTPLAAPADLSGQIVEGQVTGTTSFGAFVRLDNGQDGLVHISEIANTYVNNVNDFVNNGDRIKVKVLGKNKKGKYDLSIKQTESNKMPVGRPSYGRKFPPGMKGKRPKPPPNSFEDKIDQFLKRSEEKQLDVKRNIQGKQGIKKRSKKI